MAYSDIQNKVGQIQMANRVLLAQKMSDDQEDDQEMSDEEKNELKRKLKKQVRKTPKQRQAEARRKDPKFQGGSPGTIFVPPPEPTTDQDIQDTLQDEDMEQGDYLEDPENPHLNNLMKIGGAAAGFGGNILRMLINPLGGNALAMNFEDTGLGDGGFISTDKPHIYINRGAEAYILMPDGDFRFDGMYDPKRHGNAFPGLGLVQRNTGTKMAKLPHTPPVEKMVVGKKLMDSPLRFRTDDQREQYMNDFSRGFRYDGT